MAEKTLSFNYMGPEVEEFRGLLVTKGLLKPTSASVGVYDGETVTAVKKFQVKNALIPDGIATPRLQDLLHGATHKLTDGERRKFCGDSVYEMTIHTAILKSPTEVAPAPMKPASAYTTSMAGLVFLAGLEASISDFYVPGASSGITAGVGYDLNERWWPDVQKDFTGAGILAGMSPEKQALWKQAAELEGDFEQFKAFAAKNQGVAVLDQDQSWKLFIYIVRHTYESRVKHLFRDHRIQLTQHQFDALVSRVYNSSVDMRDAAHALIKKDTTEAVRYLGSVVTSKGVVDDALVTRREKECQLFLYGDYGVSKPLKHSFFPHKHAKKHHPHHAVPPTMKRA